MTTATSLYLTGILVLATISMLLLRWSLRRAERIRRERVSSLDKKTLQPVRTRSPLDQPVAEAMQTALDSLSSRFSIVRRLAFVSLGLFWTLAIVIPYLGTLPATIASLVAAVSAVLVGIAAKPLIENFIAGVVITFSQPIRAGDTVVLDSHYGVVEDITMTHTIVKLWDWRRYVIPNANMMTEKFVNLTLHDSYQWSHVEFWVAPDTDMKLVAKTAIDAANRSHYLAHHEPPRFWVMDMDKDGIRCWVAAWADSPTDAWQLKTQIRTSLIQDFKELGIRTQRFALNIDPSAASASSEADRDARASQSDASDGYYAASVTGSGEGVHAAPRAASSFGERE